MNVSIKILNSSSSDDPYYWTWQDYHPWWAPNDYDFELHLFSDGCLYNEARNCTAVCLDSSLIWSNHSGSDPYSNLLNCIAFPIVTQLMATNISNNAAIKAAAAQFGIVPLNKALQVQFDRSTGTCSHAYCDATGLCEDLTAFDSWTYKGWNRSAPGTQVGRSLQPPIARGPPPDAR